MWYLSKPWEADDLAVLGYSGPHFTGDENETDTWSAEEFHCQLPSVAGILHHSGPQTEACGLVILTLNEPLEPQS